MQRLFITFFVLISCQAQPKPEDNLSLVSLPESLVAERLTPDYTSWDSLFQATGDQYDLDWMLAKAVMIKESHCVERHVSYAGAVGLMQLMPREGSYFSANYRAYQQARKSPDRVHQGKSQTEWGNAYQAELEEIAALKSTDSIYQLDIRFDPKYNIKEGTRQLAGDYHFFRKQGHGPYTSQILAIAAYNAGRYAVMKNKLSPATDRIPINRQTELYVGGVQKIYLALQSGNGQLSQDDLYLLKL
ncbi:MAG: transglycosylase SLT domain-containing protein [Bacteroidia bacterium]